MLKRFAFVFGLSFILVHPSANSETSPQTLIFNTQDFAPFSYLENNHVAGVGNEIVMATCEQAKLICTSKLLPWRRAMNQVEHGEAHGLFVVGKNEEREKWLYFSHPILKTEYGFFNRKDSGWSFNSLSDIVAKEIGVFGPSNTSYTLEAIQKDMKEKKLQEIIITMDHDDIQLFKKLNHAHRKMDAVFSNRDVGQHFIKQYEMKNIKYAGAFKALDYYIGLSKKYVSIETFEAFNNALQTLKENGTLKQIADKHHLQTLE